MSSFFAWWEEVGRVVVRWFPSPPYDYDLLCLRGGDGDAVCVAGPIYFLLGSAAQALQIICLFPQHHHGADRYWNSLLAINLMQLWVASDNNAEDKMMIPEMV